MVGPQKKKVLDLETKGHGNDPRHQLLKLEHEPKGRGGGEGLGIKVPLKGREW